MQKEENGVSILKREIYFVCLYSPRIDIIEMYQRYLTIGDYYCKSSKSLSNYRVVVRIVGVKRRKKKEEGDLTRDITTNPFSSLSLVRLHDKRV